MGENIFLFIYGLVLLSPIVIPLTIALINFITKYKVRRRIKDIAENFSETTPEELMKTRGITYNRRRISFANQYALIGVYILYNTSKKKYYVGQSVNVFRRIRSHFTGNGNLGVYLDYIAGDKFSIRVIPLSQSGYISLNSLERDTITAYNAYYKGYNKTRGNRG